MDIFLQQKKAAHRTAQGREGHESFWLKRIAQAKAEFVGIGGHAHLLLPKAVNGLFVLGVSKADEAICEVSRDIVRERVGYARASIPGEDCLHFRGAFAANAGNFDFIFASQEAHTHASADIRGEGCGIVEIPISVQEQGLQPPRPLEVGSVAAVLEIPAGRGVRADGVFKFRAQRNLIQGIEIVPHIHAAANGVLRVVADVKSVDDIPTSGHRPRALNGIKKFKADVESVVRSKGGCGKRQTQRARKKKFFEHTPSCTFFITFLLRGIVYSNRFIN